MPTIYLRKDLYDKIVSMGKEVNSFVNKLVEENLKPKETLGKEQTTPKPKSKAKPSKGGQSNG
jgi:predicted CopG family antitoxin